MCPRRMRPRDGVKSRTRNSKGLQLTAVKEPRLRVLLEVFGPCNDGRGLDAELVAVFDDFHDVEGVDEEGGDGGA